MTQVMNSPFRYAGGKFYARNLILEKVPAHTKYIEPFAGGASIFFAKPKVQENWINDFDPELYNVYIHIRDHADALIHALKDEVATKERHGWYKNEYKPSNDLERAVRWYYLNRTSYSGIMNMQNCYWGYGEKFSMRPENWGRNIQRTSNKLQGVKITNLDFSEVIESAPDGAFLFLDPPYYNADQDKFYACSFTLNDHLRLSDKLKEHAGRLQYLITYDNSQEVRDLYDWAIQIEDKEWNYTIQRTDDQTKNGTSKNQEGKRVKGKEIFITNYEPVAPIEQLVLSF